MLSAVSWTIPFSVALRVLCIPTLMVWLRWDASWYMRSRNMDVSVVTFKHVAVHFRAAILSFWFNFQYFLKTVLDLICCFQNGLIQTETHYNFFSKIQYLLVYGEIFQFVNASLFHGLNVVIGQKNANTNIRSHTAVLAIIVHFLIASIHNPWCAWCCRCSYQERTWSLWRRFIHMKYSAFASMVAKTAWTQFVCAPSLASER